MCQATHQGLTCTMAMVNFPSRPREKKFTDEEYQSLTHTRWDGKYHVVFIPKRWKTKTDVFLPQADPVSNYATALDTVVDRLDSPPTVPEGMIRHLLLQCQLLAPWFLGRHKDVHLGKRNRRAGTGIAERAEHRQQRR